MRYLWASALFVALCNSGFGQIVQLPSVTTFGTSGTVSVPDQGTAYMGGNSSMRSGLSSSGFGPLASRARGVGVGGSSVSVTATIIDLQAMDEALLNRPPKYLPPNSYPPKYQGKPLINTLAPKKYDAMTNKAPRQTTTANDWAIALGSPGDAPLETSTTENNVRYFMGQAAEAQAAGHVAAAKVYYRMALERMTPDQRQRMDKLQERNAEAARRGVRPSELESVLKKEAAEKAARTTSTTPATQPEEPEPESPF